MKIQNSIALKPSPEKVGAERDGQLRDAAKMYETHFLNEMVKAMRSTVGQEEGALMKPTFAEKIFTEQLDQQYVDGWAQRGGVGLADMIYNQLSDRFGEKGKHIRPLQGPMIPLAPKSEIHGIVNPDTIQMKSIPTGDGRLSYRFTVPQPAAGDFEVCSPLSGQVMGTRQLDQGWSGIRLSHGQGLVSELTFPGSLVPIDAGMTVKPGQKLGNLNSSTPVLAWNLEWKSESALDKTS